MVLGILCPCPKSQPQLPTRTGSCLSIVHRADCGRQREREIKRDLWRNSGTCQKLGTFPSTTEQWTLFKWGYDLNHIWGLSIAVERAREGKKTRRLDRESGIGGEISSFQAVRIQLVSRCGPRLPFPYLYVTRKEPEICSFSTVSDMGLFSMASLFLLLYPALYLSLSLYNIVVEVRSKIKNDLVSRLCLGPSLSPRHHLTLPNKSIEVDICSTRTHTEHTRKQN